LLSELYARWYVHSVATPWRYSGVEPMSKTIPMNSSRTDRASGVSRKHQRRLIRLLIRTSLVLILLAFFAVAGFVLWLRAGEKAALPQLDGDVHLAGLSAPVSVIRDAHGVPHIQAATQSDMLVAQGYVTAQDRLWQMDAYRRNADGNLAEIMGTSLVRHDETQRVLQFRNTAQRIYANLPAEDRARLDDYARGVNLFIAQSEDASDLPVEFKLLGYRPEPWTGVDSISVGMMMVQMLDTHWPTKLARARIAAKLNDPKLIADLYPVGSWRDRPPTGITLDLSQPHAEPAAPSEEDDEEDEPSSASAVPAHGSLSAAPVGTNALLNMLGLPTCEGCAAGSNNWVVSGSHTASGKPLLSNDMHLSLRVPNIWYMADISAPGFHAAGVTLPGLPFVVAGHNEHVAWGFTALQADVQDLYEEKLDGSGNYLDDNDSGTSGTWKPLKVDHEVIHVRGSHDVSLDVSFTERGPLLNPLLTKDSTPLSLRWTLYDNALNKIPLYEINTASNWSEFSSAIANWNWPTQNIVYADDQGHIAYHAIGRIPIRPGGLKSVPVADGTHEWQGYIPYDSLPNAVDPPSGFLATANSRVTTESAPYPLTLEWTDPYRAERIYKLLDGRSGLTPKDMLAVQTDVYSEMDQEFGQRLAYAIDHTEGVDARLRQAADLMRSWDGQLATDSSAASLVTQTRRVLWPLILQPKLGQLAADYRWEESTFAEEEIVMHAKAEWLPPSYENWDALLTDAVRKSMGEGKAPSDVSHWAYGSWHVVDLEHPLAEFLPLIGRAAGTGAHPQSGDTTTIKQVGREFGPSQRFTMDWSNVDGSTENIVLGESGDPYSPYFRDQWNDWYGGTTFALPFTSTAVAAQGRHALHLLP
jgi:penicillin amidase